jgi:3-hydroxyisobutyrate dehydrogenase
MEINEKAMSVGWIGAGRMGYALIERLLDAGHDVSVYNRTRSKAEPLAARGAKLVDTPAQLVDRDVVFIMVAASDDLEHVTVGEDGLLTADASPQVVIDCSTVSAAISEKIRGLAAAKGTTFLAAPVSGNPKVVRSGKLTLAVSGPREAYESTEHLLRPLGRGVTYVGEGEVARLVKICHNVFLGVVAQSLARTGTAVWYEKPKTSQATPAAKRVRTAGTSTISRAPARIACPNETPARMAWTEVCDRTARISSAEMPKTPATTR